MLARVFLSSDVSYPPLVSRIYRDSCERTRQTRNQRRSKQTGETSSELNILSKYLVQSILGFRRNSVWESFGYSEKDICSGKFYGKLRKLLWYAWQYAGGFGTRLFFVTNSRKRGERTRPCKRNRVEYTHAACTFRNIYGRRPVHTTR